MPPVEAAGDPGAERLERGREAYASREWLAAHAALETADRATPLGAEDLELLATSASMLGRDDEYLQSSRARPSRTSRGGRDAREAARCAFWAGTAARDPRRDGARRRLARPRAATGRTGGARLRRARIPARARDDGAGGSAATPRRVRHAVAAAEIAERFGDADLLALAVHQQGRSLLKQGRREAGVRAARRNHAGRHLR